MADGLYTLTTTSSTTNVWITWINDTTGTCTTGTTTTTTSDDTFTIWCAGGNGNNIYYPPTPPRNIESDEHRTQRIKLEKQRTAELAEANRRAEKLLLEVIDTEQRQQYKKHKHVIVHGKENRYRINPGRVGNIDVINKRGQIIHRLCAHPAPHDLPDCDVMTAQVLALQLEEDRFLAIANKHAHYGDSRAVLPVVQ